MRDLAGNARFTGNTFEVQRGAPSRLVSATRGKRETDYQHPYVKP
jgi:hypothetical protein